MRETLYIRWRDAVRQPLRYALVQAQAPGSVVVEQAAQDEILSLAQGRRVVLLVPGSAVQLAMVELPTRQASKILQAVPYLLEEQLADDIETLHFAVGQRQADARYPVAVVAHSLMNAWLAPFRDHGIEIDAVVPETLCLPKPTGDAPWPVLVEPERLTVRSGEFSGFSCLPEDFSTFLGIAENGTDPHALQVLLMDGSSANDFDAGGRPAELLPGYRDPLQALVRHYAPAAAINLLQGTYSRRANLQRLWRPWRLAAALLVAVFAVAWLANLVDAVRLDHQAQAQQTANVQRFHALFPDEPASLELSLAIQQVATRAGTRSADSAMLPLLQQTSAALTATGGLSVQELQYRDHALYVNLTGSDLQALDRLRAWSASHPHTHLDVQNANASGNSVQVLIKITAS